MFLIVLVIGGMLAHARVAPKAQRNVAMKSDDCPSTRSQRLQHWLLLTSAGARVFGFAFNIRFVAGTALVASLCAG
jgi:hypothetical protein